MSVTDAESKNSFLVSKKPANSSFQPLEVYHLSHDLRGPLNSILGFSELLLEGVEGPLNENQEADIGAINQSAQNLLRLINNLVDLSKLEADCLNFEFVAVEVNKVVQKILADDFGASKPEQLELAANLPKAEPVVSGDRDRVEQMVMSLVRFGFKMQKTGQIVITVAVEEAAGEVIIQVRLAETRLEPEQLAGLFELGVQVDETGRSKLGLGGLELPLARGLAEKHGGRLWAESIADQGLAFYLGLPVYQATAPG